MARSSYASPGMYSLAGPAKIAFRSSLFRPDKVEKRDPAASSVFANRRANSSDGRGRPRASWTNACGSAPSWVSRLRARISPLSPSRIVWVRPEVSKTVRVPSGPVTVCCSSQSVCGLARIRTERTRDPSSSTASSVCNEASEAPSVPSETQRPPSDCPAGARGWSSRYLRRKTRSSRISLTPTARPASSARRAPTSWA